MVEGEISIELLVSHPFDKERRMDGAPGWDQFSKLASASRTLQVSELTAVLAIKSFIPSRVGESRWATTKEIIMGNDTQALNQPPTRLTGAEIVWATLVGEGVTDVFGYPGGAILPGYDALRKFPIHHTL